MSSTAGARWRTCAAKSRSRRLRGRFPYNKKAVLSDGGRTGRPRKEQFAPRAFAYNVEHKEVDIRLLVGHEFSKPLASRGAGTLDLQDFVLPSELGYVRLTGIVLDPDGAPAADARVYIMGPAEADPILYEPVTTDPTGRFALSLAGDMEYRLFAVRESPGDPARPQSSKELRFTALDATPPLKVTLRRRY